MKMIIIALATLMSVSAFAGNRCLQTVSDSELVAELAYRLRTDAPGQIGRNSFQYVLSCDPFGTISVIANDTLTGSISKKTFALGNGAECRDIKNRLDAKVSVPSSGAIVTVSCDPFGRMSKIILVQGDIKKETVRFSNGEECRSVAESLNR